MYTSLLDRRARPLGVSAAPPSDSPSSRALAVSIMYHRTLTSSSRVSEHVMEGPPEGESDPNMEGHHRSPLTTRSSHGSLQLIIQQTSVSSPSLTCSAQCSAQPRPLCRVSPIRRRFRHSPTDIGFITAGRFHEWRRSGRPACWPGVRCSWGTRSGWGSGARATGAGELPAQSP